jgi:hypothetical protein
LGHGTLQKLKLTHPLRLFNPHHERSAELHSAVSPISNRQDVQRIKAAGFSRIAEFNSAIRQIENLRYK